MRTIQLSIVLLSLISLLAFGNRLFRSFDVESQANTLSAPTNVTASDNAYSTKVGISWDAVHGASLYRIFRNTSNDSASALNLGATAEGRSRSG